MRLLSHSFRSGKGRIFSNGKFGTYLAFAFSIIRIYGGAFSFTNFKVTLCAKIIQLNSRSPGGRDAKGGGIFLMKAPPTKLLSPKKRPGPKKRSPRKPQRHV